ncbi:MAG: protein kinase [Planctomycetota bacterium]|nr:protein kinase [Planctomycetota bacterium]
MSNAACLEQRELEQLALGQLDDDQLQSAQSHLDACSTCLERLQQVTVHDSVTAAMEAAAMVKQDLAAVSEPIEQLLQEFEEQSTWELLRSHSQLAAADRPTGSAFAHERPLKLGSVLGNYVIEGLLGRGGMGIVYKARHRRMDRHVALKVVSPREGRDPAAAAMFQDEVKALARLNHPNIVTAHDADEAEGIQFLVMEYVDGSDLLSLIRASGALPVATAVGYTMQAAQGLAYAHEQGIIHRDIKPANLVLDRQGVIKVLDLGLARWGDVAESGEELERNGDDSSDERQMVAASHDNPTRDLLLGTIDFVAPEQAERATCADERADIYSLGCTLYYLLTAQTVRSGQSSAEKLAALREQTAPSVRSIRGDVPEQLDVIVGRMLATRPEDRVQSMNEVIAALQPFTERDVEATATPANRSRTKTGIGLASGAVLVLLACSIGFVASRWRRERQAGLNTSPKRTFAVEQASRPRVQEIATATAPPGDGPVASDTASMDTASMETLPFVEDVRRQVDRLLETLRQPDAPDDEVWHAFQSTEDPTLRTELIHRLEPAGVPLERLVDRLAVETDHHARAGLLLAIGEYDPANLSAVQTVDLPVLLLSWYEHDPAPVVHSAIAWLARRWQESVGRNKSSQFRHEQDALPLPELRKALFPPTGESLHEAISALSPVLEQKLIPRDGGWYQTMQGQTMVVLKEPATFRMGSPDDEPDRVTGEPFQDESQRWATISHTFAIATTEVTKGQYRAAHELHWERPEPEFPGQPIQGISWDDAVWYCNRLSELEGIPPVECCYELLPEPGPAGKYREKSDALSLAGYRLPTTANAHFRQLGVAR